MKKIIAFTILTLIGFNSFANDNAKRITEQYLRKDISEFKNGGNNMITYYVEVVNASQLINEYINNPNIYKKTYHKRIINIKAVASGIKTDFLGKKYVIANGENKFEYVSLEMHQKDDLLNINKGDELNLICAGTLNNAKFPILKNCLKTDVYLQMFLEKTMNDINELKEDDHPKNYYEAVYLGLSQFDAEKPNQLNKYKTIDDLFENKTLFNEIWILVGKKWYSDRYIN